MSVLALPTRTVQRVHPNSFELTRHFYQRVLNAQLHPMVRYFFSLGNDRIAERYIHMHPEIDPEAVGRLLEHTPRFFRWGGSDLFHVTTEKGNRRIIVIETNSSPSGQKSMPFLNEVYGEEGYRCVLERALLPMLRQADTAAEGDLAVLYDKNEMETSGYAATLADLTDEPVWWVPFFDGDPEPPARFTDDGVLEIRTPEGAWHPIRAAFRYVTQRPWNRIPPLPRTALLNPPLVCLAGGRNKMLAAKAYDLFNAERQQAGPQLRVPETIWDVAQSEVPLWVERMNGFAVVKNPYSNAGQGVYTITNETELAAFMATDFPYDRFIVQGLVGNYSWSSETAHGRFYHVGTVPNRRGNIYVSDLRFMIGAGPGGFFPVAMYARRARKPLAKQLQNGCDSWAMLGTNLSVKQSDGSWTTEPERLLLMDRRDFNKLGLGLDDLIGSYLQTIMAVTAIDEMAQRLIDDDGAFRYDSFRSLNPDPSLADEIYV